MVEVKLLMALTKENDAVGKESARNDPSSSGQKDLVFVKSSADDIKVTIPGVERPWLSEAEVTDYDSVDESSVCSTPLPLLKKLEGAEPISGPKTIKSILKSKSTLKAEALKGVIINEPSSTPAKGNKSSSASKVHSAPAGKLKSVKIEDEPPLAIDYLSGEREREINPRNPQHAFKRCEACGSSNHTTTDHYDIEWFKRGEALQAKKAEALKSTKAESSNANRSKTPTKSQLYDAKYIIQIDKKRGTIFNSNKEIVMIAPRVRDVYVLDMMSSAQESCFFAKAFENLNWLWHKILAHLNFKIINKLAKQNLVICLTSLVYSKDKPYSSCEKGKHHRATFKTKHTSSIKKCLHLLHMDLFRPVTLRSINHEKYTLVIVDEYSRYTWVHFSKKKIQSPKTIMSFIKRVENQNDIKVKQLRTNNGTEFRNSILVNFCDEKGISQNFSSPYTPEQNGVDERKNRTLIEAARKMLLGSVFSKQYWTEAVATACYSQKKFTIVKRHLKTPYEIFRKRIPNINFLHVFGCPVYIHNHKDHLGKFDEKADDGYLLGYSLVSKAFRVFNTRRQQIEETYHITFDERPSVDNINIAETERYPPDEYLHPYEPSQRVFNTRRQQIEETYHITFDESPEAIKFSKPSVDNINIAETERYPPDEYLHPYEPSQRYQTNSNDVSFIEPYECPEPVVLETEVSSDQNGHTDQNDQSVQDDEILNDDHSEHFNHTNDEQIIDNLPNIKDSQIFKLLSSLNTEDTSAQNTTQIPSPPLPVPSMVTLAPQDRWSQDKHIELVNIIGNPGVGILTRAMAKQLSAASAHECLFVDFLFGEEPKKVYESLC
ncbi:retrovirus-related pol polyprotein from transposon TNT 1-94 [Tanacetum coccineum]